MVHVDESSRALLSPLANLDPAISRMGSMVIDLSDQQCAPSLIIARIFESTDGVDQLSAVERAVYALSQRLSRCNTRTNAVWIALQAARLRGSVDAYQDELAAAFVLLASDEAVAVNGAVLAKEQGDETWY